MRKRTVKILTGVAVALVLLGLIYSVAVGISAARLRGAYAALREDGRPMTPEEVIPPEVPEGQNAAPLYESAALLLKAQPAPEKDLLTYLGDLSQTFTDGTIAPDKLVEFKRLIERDAVIHALWIVEQGTQRDSCRFDLDYEAGINIILQHLRHFRQFARILGAKALLDARAGHPDSAWGAIRAQLHLADAMRAEPVLVSQLVRIAIVRISCGTIRQLYEIEPPNGQQFADIKRLLKSFDDVRPLVNAIDGERLLFGEWAFNLPKRELLRQQELFSGEGDVLTVLGACFKPLRLAYHRSYLRIMHKSAEFTEQPHSPDQTRAVNEMIERESRGLAFSLLPAMGRLKVLHARTYAQIRITRTGLDLLQNKQAGGTFPQTLTQFEPAQVKDPFSGAPLIYRSGEEDFLLYSVGPDRKDSGGLPKQDDAEADWDIVWQFPGPEKTPALPNETTRSSPPGELRLGGEHIERLVLNCEDGPAKTFERPGKSIMLPAGRYRLRQLILEGGFTHDAPEPMDFESMDSEWDDATSIVVTAARPAKLNIGGPIRHWLKVRKDTRYLSMQYNRVGVGGERYLPAGPGKPPVFTVYRGNKKVGSGQLEPIGGGTCTQSWRVPLTVWGHLTILPTADIGIHGPADGAATSFHWKWYYGPVRFTMWLLVGLAIVLVKANRNTQALVILAPLLAVIIIWALICTTLPSDSGSTMVFNLLVFSVTAGITLLWLLAQKLGNCNPPIAFLSALAIMAVASTIGVISYDLHDLQGDAEVAIIMLCLLELGMLFGFVRAARACRQSYSLGRFMTRLGFWILLCSVGLMFALWLFGFLLNYGHDLEDLPECLFGGGVLGLLIFMVNIPFIILAFHNSFFGERFRTCLRLAPAQ